MLCVYMSTHTHIFTMGYYSAIRDRNLAIWDNMDEPGRHYAKPDIERQILQELTYKWNLK